MIIGLKAMNGRHWLAASNILTLPCAMPLAWRDFFALPRFTHSFAHSLLAIPFTLCFIFLLIFSTPATAAQQYEKMSDSVRSSLQQQINDSSPPRLFFDRPAEGRRWLDEMSRRLAKILPQQSVLQEESARRKFLIAVHYEATRAGLDAQLMLAVMHVESAFRKYAISSASARGLMQVMPFWTKEIGDGDVRKLFKLRANLRYGAVILRHYLDKENGDLNRALGRYNGSLGRSTYPNLVHAKLKKYWTWRS
ncbi:MAG: lytic transglycosylase domain-containing protein [Gammaproteobacteria bacterium WSBS_2016_MAG_OTU1]